ncbi:MAG: hypothetical protein DDT40_00167 [candidate division WS2 bacterium]|uniref:Threonine-phosphate decarboxylase n=1 Tax=Psychracetigena formicireducens TaxID=2986056 RepID=A0A9E2F0X9_PSYF1|nr:hypothetical protein [Candidatus Psychracetigena formicireducens]MBT9144177.1 hypothetical protein [Candidatus Psychracetigena formicireducens]MBT9150001.1 hypothetical protein [Candidatus Psychracetigena formicireducens]
MSNGSFHRVLRRKADNWRGKKKNRAFFDRKILKHKSPNIFIDGFRKCCFTMGNLLAFEHGGNIYKIKRKYGDEVIDFSANINPIGLP